MPFVYRLQKVLEFRIRAKEQQLLVVQKAQQDVYLQEEKIRQNEADNSKQKNCRFQDDGIL